MHASFSGYVAREMGKAEALLKVVGSRPENLVDNFFTLMPSGSPADFQRILELKAGCPHDACWEHSWNCQPHLYVSPSVCMLQTVAVRAYCCPLLVCLGRCPLVWEVEEGS